MATEITAEPQGQYGRGMCELRLNNPTFFAKRLLNQGLLHEKLELAWDEVAENGKPVSLPDHNQLIAGTELITSEIINRSYSFSPNKAFIVNKDTGDERLLEIPSPEDLAVERVLLELCAKYFDRTLEDESYGFRKNRSRADALQAIAKNIKDGYIWIVEADIEDFFPSIDLTRLNAILDSLIPLADAEFRHLLSQALGKSFVIGRTEYARQQGLAQGSPLSPLLANLYLDSFDETVKKRAVKIVRFADDFVIMTRSETEAGEALRHARKELSRIGLKIKEEKTGIIPAERGFKFLGINIRPDALDKNSLNRALKLSPNPPLNPRKTLYILQNGAYLGMSGDAARVSIKGRLQRAVPFRRLDSVIAAGSISMSSAFLGKCAANNIPVAFAGRGFKIEHVITPDSKSFLEISHLHAGRYYDMSKTEKMVIATEIVRSKLISCQTLFQKRYRKGSAEIIRRLDDFIGQAAMVDNPAALNCVEGRAARFYFAQFNSCIIVDDFKFVKRERSSPDRLNSLLNIAYSLLFHLANASLRNAGLNPYLGFLHSGSDRFESLAADVSEPFRARIDNFVINSINLQIIKPDDFISDPEQGMRLKSAPFKRFLDKLEGELHRKSRNSAPSFL